jgi:adenylate cyclase
MVSQLLRHGLDGDPVIATLTDGQEALWLLLWCVAGGMIGLWTHSFWRFVLVGAGGLLHLGLVTYIALLHSWWIPSVPPALAWLGTTALVTAYVAHLETAQRLLLMQLFSRHVSPEVAEEIWEQREQFFEGGRLRPQQLIATVVFTDLVGSTTVAEKLTQAALMDWLNMYMNAMAQQVIIHGGIIDKYMGDAIMALFGVPLARNTETEIGRDAVRAVECAIAMERTLKELNRAWQEQQAPMIGMRLGIYTGPLVAGSLGGTQRLEYTVIGDTVVTASRLESVDKHLFVPDHLEHPCRIFIGETTRRYLGDRFQTRRVGEVRLKGQDRVTPIYHVIG